MGQALYDIAASRAGLFTTRQAASAGYPPPLLAHHQKAGRIARVRRGVYRLIHFPPRRRTSVTTAELWEVEAVLAPFGGIKG
jgi:predicted transcriptional regulator of viral defense system